MMFWSKPKAPAPVSTDQVVPMNYFDNTLVFRNFIFYSLFVFDAQLDPEKLRSSLEQLVRRDGWRKLGARFRQNANGGLELHIPSVFNSDRPAIAYTECLNPDTAISSHPLASRLPKPTTVPTVLGDPNEFLELACGPDGPKHADEYFLTDRPGLGLHIVTFADATLVGISWLHCLFDAMGKKALMDAWVLTLQGRGDEVKTPYAWDSDPLAELGKNPTMEHNLAARRVRGMGTVGFAGLLAVDVLLKPKESRTLCIPGKYVQDLRETVLAELAENDPEDRWVSEGDVLLAVWARGALAHLPKTSSKTLCIQIAANSRKVLEADLLPKDSVFLGNCLSFICVLLTASDVLQKPVSYTALEIRRAIRSQRSREHVEAYSALVREDDAKRVMPLFGDSTMQLMSFSNWAQADMFSVDFGAARVESAGGSNMSPCYPRYLQNMQVGPVAYPEGYVVIGKDRHGNYWGGGCRVKGLWDKLGAEFAQMT